jgi:hypothetical protein
VPFCAGMAACYANEADEGVGDDDGKHRLPNIETQ